MISVNGKLRATAVSTIASTAVSASVASSSVARSVRGLSGASQSSSSIPNTRPAAMKQPATAAIRAVSKPISRRAMKKVRIPPPSTVTCAAIRRTARLSIVANGQPRQLT